MWRASESEKPGRGASVGGKLLLVRRDSSTVAKIEGPPGNFQYYFRQASVQVGLTVTICANPPGWATAASYASRGTTRPTTGSNMLFSKRSQSLGPLLKEETEGLLKDLSKRSARDPISNLLLIFSVAEIIEFKQDAHKLIRRLSTLCVLLSSLVTALVLRWLMDVMTQTQP
jgi:hypothetical protein